MDGRHAEGLLYDGVHHSGVLVAVYLHDTAELIAQ